MSAPAWMRTQIRPVGGATLVVHVSVAWWTVSYWRWMRDHIETRPAWLAWPIAVWMGLVFAWRMR